MDAQKQNEGCSLLSPGTFHAGVFAELEIEIAIYARAEAWIGH
jgi:hypothetical protein